MRSVCLLLIGVWMLAAAPLQAQEAKGGNGGKAKSVKASKEGKDVKPAAKDTKASADKDKPAKEVKPAEETKPKEVKPAKPDEPREVRDPSAARLRVDVKLATKIQDRKPVEPADAFGPGKLYCWNEIRGGEGDFVVHHVWYRDGKQVWKRSLSAKGKKWVTWSFHNVSPGSWKVKVTDAGRAVLQTAEFTVK